jgi:long-subunit acyl-CoA synthetase (AMP-forming)
LALVMLAGAPISKNLVLAVQAVVDGEVRAPYGMTECLPVTDGTSPLRTGPLGGTSTGRALPGCVVEIDEIDGGWGEILVSAPWMFDGYDARWSADNSSIVARGLRRLHRTGDVGYLDDDVLFQLGRLQHVIRTSSGPSPSVAIEEPIATALDRDVAAVAVGAAGTSVIAVVVSDDVALHLAPHHLAQRVRDASSLPIAAVLCGRLPTDRRHESKVDRTHLAQLVQRFLAGR